MTEPISIYDLAAVDRLRAELDVYNELLPAREQLQAALVIDVADETRLRTATQTIYHDRLRSSHLILPVAP